MKADNFGVLDGFHRSWRKRGAQTCLGTAFFLLMGQAGAQPEPTPPDPAPAVPAPAAPAPAAPAPTAPAPTAPAPTAPAPTDPAGGDSVAPKTEAAREKAAEPDDPNAPELDPDPGLQPPHGAGWDKRPMPDYDGRGDDPTTAGDVFIWIPRGLVFPVYLVSEYVIRWPVGKLVSALDEADLPGILGDFFTFGPGDKFGLVPSFLIDFGFRPSIGVYFFGDDIGNVDGLGVRSHVAFGGEDFYRATATVRYSIHEAKRDQSEKFVQIKGIYAHRPDNRFWGIGPDTLSDDSSRYGTQEVGGQARYEGGFWRSSTSRIWAGVKNVDYKNLGCCEDLVIRDAVAQRLYTLPDLFDTGYFTVYGGANISVDTREVRTPPELPDASDWVEPTGSGVKVNLRGEYHRGIQSIPDTPSSNEGDLSFIRYGGTVGAYLDVYKQRVFGLQAVVDFVDPTSADGQIPFSELASLGGNRPLRGFLDQRLLGRSSAALELEYRWPIWVTLDGKLNYSVGNVFGEHLQDFEAEKLRQSFTFGFAAAGARDHSFELLLGLGTQTFEQGSTVDSFRFVFGSTSGF